MRAKELMEIRSNHIHEFRELMSQSEINFEFLNKFDIDFKAFGFTDIIDLVDQNCDSFVSDELLLEIGGPREKMGKLTKIDYVSALKKLFC